MLDEVRIESDAKLIAFLGPRIATFEKFQRTLPVRAEADRMRARFELVREPLAEAQRSQLLSILTDEFERSSMPGYTDADDRNIELERNLLERVKPFLTSSQFEHFTRFRQLESALTFGASPDSAR